MVVHKKKLAAITSFTVVGLMATSPVYANPAEGLSEEVKEQTSPASPEIQPELGNNEISLESPIAFPVTNPDQPIWGPGPQDNPGDNIGDEPDPTDPGDDPGEEPDPKDPDNPGGGDPGDGTPGGDNPGGDNPGGDNPGGGDDSNPGEGKPGGGSPGGSNPGGGSPGDGNDGGITQPEPTDPGTPPYNPESVNTLPHAKDQQLLASKDGAELSKTEEEGGKLPKTSISHPTQMAGGLMMSLLGAAMLFIRRFRSNGA